MTKTEKRAVPVLHSFYEVHLTDEFNKTIEETLYLLEVRFGQEYAEKWLQKVADFLQRLETPKTLGMITPQDFSNQYGHYQVPGTETTVFFLVEEDVIYLAYSGYSGRNWPDVLKTVQPEIERQIEILKRNPEEP